MEKKVKVLSLTRTCTACPSQWEGIASGNRRVYIRFRWGSFSIAVSEPGKPIHHLNDVIYTKQLDGFDGFDGYLTDKQMIEACNGILEFNKRLVIENGE